MNVSGIGRGGEPPNIRALGDYDPSEDFAAVDRWISEAKGARDKGDVPAEQKCMTNAANHLGTISHQFHCFGASSTFCVAINSAWDTATNIIYEQKGYGELEEDIKKAKANLPS